MNQQTTCTVLPTLTVVSAPPLTVVVLPVESTGIVYRGTFSVGLVTYLWI